MLSGMSGKLIGYSGLGGFGAPGLLALPQGTTGHVSTASSMTTANPRLVNAPTFTLPVVPQTSRPPGTAAFTVPAGVLQAALAAQAAQSNQTPAPQPTGTGWDGLSTGAKVGILGGGFLLLLGVAYVMTKTSKSTTEVLTPNRSRRRRYRANGAAITSVKRGMFIQRKRGGPVWLVKMRVKSRTRRAYYVVSPTGVRKVMSVSEIKAGFMKPDTLVSTRWPD